MIKGCSKTKISILPVNYDLNGNNKPLKTLAVCEIGRTDSKLLQTGIKVKT